MKGFQFEGILQKKGWLQPGFVGVDNSGNIKEISEHPNPAISYEKVHGFALPGIPNTHSHAFQYAMAGLAERHLNKAEKDDFWSWRNAMYGLALSVNPDQVEAIAAFLYSEMLRYGYTHVIEFHYLHHDEKGQAYAQPGEMGLRHIEAAKRAGIRITLIPILYQKSGFGKEALPEQRRFIHTKRSQYWKMLDECLAFSAQLPDVQFGVGVHSIRAVDPEHILEFLNEMPKDLPFHIHLAEQPKEISDTVQYLGQRPVEWFSNHTSMTDQFNLVHCTHLTREEVEMLGQSNANVVLCPSTEANLGDGIFPLKDFQAQGGRWSIGTDSHIGLNPFEELRILDYGQRLLSHNRNTFFDNGNDENETYAFRQMILNGRKAAGLKSNEFFEIGKSLDALVIDANNPLLAVTSNENLLNTIVYTSDSYHCLGTLVNGKWVVRGGEHYRSDEIRAKFITALSELKIR